MPESPAMRLNNEKVFILNANIMFKEDQKMKKIICVVCLLLLSISSTIFAQDKSPDARPADNYGVYLGLVGGISIPIETTKVEWTSSSGALQPRDLDAKMNYGFLYGFKVGWLTPFTNRIMAVELEYNHLENKYDSASVEGLNGNMSGKISINQLMLNLLARKPTGKFHPYVGFGLGYADVTVDKHEWTADIMPFPQTFTGGSAGVLAYQALLGVDFDVYKNISVGIGYKYIATAQKVSYDSIMILSSSRGHMDVDYRSHNLVLNVAYTF